DVHPPHSGQHPFDEEDLGRAAEEQDRPELDRLVDEDLQRVGARPRQPVHVLGGVVRLVDAPQDGRAVLQAVEPVDVEVVQDEEEQHLRRHRPVRHQAEAREPRARVDPHDQVLDDQAEDVALQQCIEQEIRPEPIAEELLPPIVGVEALERDQHQRAAHDQDEGEDVPGHGRQMPSTAPSLSGSCDHRTIPNRSPTATASAPARLMPLAPIFSSSSATTPMRFSPTTWKHTVSFADRPALAAAARNAAASSGTMNTSPWPPHVENPHVPTRDTPAARSDASTRPISPGLSAMAIWNECSLVTFMRPASPRPCAAASSAPPAPAR